MKERAEKAIQAKANPLNFIEDSKEEKKEESKVLHNIEEVSQTEENKDQIAGGYNESD